MPYRVRVTETARQEIRDLPGHVRQRVRRLVDSLASNPTPLRSRELRGMPAHYRVPLLNWRIIYLVDEESEIILVLTVRHKRGPETYQGLE